ncbi:MAG: phosphoribosylanthranilate isomerase [Simkaniaceae bacterium]|nr:phosphoribosylanthranilate isomerase [Simkaniaceae bacterium]
MTEVKICGITDPETGLFAAEEGARFIGLIFDPLSARTVSVERARKIVSALAKTEAIPVGVFTARCVTDLVSIVCTTEVGAVQLHGKEVQEVSRTLPEALIRFYVLRVTQGGEVLDRPPHFADKKRDFLLYDGVIPGTGKAFDRSRFRPDRSFRFFLAGGLSPDNVREAVFVLKPTGVDVATGVEDGNTGRKDRTLIRLFIRRAREVA